MGNITSRRGHIEGMEARGNGQVVTPWFRLQKCLVMQQPCVHKHKAVEHSRWYLTITKKYLKTSLMKLSKKIAVND